MTARAEVIAKLSQDALAAMDGCGVDDLTVNEVVSAVFTMCHHVTAVLMEHSSGPEREHNRHQLIEAIMALYEMVKPPTVN